MENNRSKVCSMGRIISIVLGIILYLSLYYLRDSKLVQRFVIKRVLEVAAVYPKTRSLKLAPPLLKISKLDDFDKENIEIRRTDLYNQLPPIIEILKEYPNDFMIDQIDWIVINKMGVEVLIVEKRTEDKVL